MILIDLLSQQHCSATHNELDITECLFLYSVIQHIAGCWVAYARKAGTRVDEPKYPAAIK